VEPLTLAAPLFSNPKPLKHRTYRTLPEIVTQNAARGRRRAGGGRSRGTGWNSCHTSQNSTRRAIELIDDAINSIVQEIRRPHQSPWQLWRSARRQCGDTRLGRRIPDKQTLIVEVAAWEKDRNKRHTKADWHYRRRPHQTEAALPSF
jgi:hypothetical protein